MGDGIHPSEDMLLFGNAGDMCRLVSDLGFELDTSPGCPELPKFVRDMTSIPSDVYCKLLLTTPTDISIPGGKLCNTLRVRMLPGHTWSGPYGPSPGCSDVVVIGKMPWKAEITYGRLFVDEGGIILRKAFEKYGVNPNNFYLTNVCRFMPPVKNLSVAWINMCQYFLYQEISIIKPKYILILGSDALKGIYGSKAKMSYYRGAVGEYMGAKVWVAYHPSAVINSPKLEPEFDNDIRGFCNFYLGKQLGLDPVYCDYACIDNLQDLNTWVDGLIAENIEEFAVDCEWAGPRHTKGQLLTIQVSWDIGKARLIHLRSKGSIPRFSPDIRSAVDPLKRLLMRKGVKIIGHWFVSDLLWLIDFGLDLRENFFFDTMLAHHAAVDEAGAQDLDILRAKYTQMPKYDLELEQYKANNNINKDDGYGEIPDHILHPYALSDVDCEFRAYKALKPIVDASPSFRKLFYEVVMPGNLPILEIRRNGMLTDVKRYIEISEAYARKADELLARIREATGYDNFNPRSSPQMQKLLYTDLGLEPLVSTSGLPWSRVRHDPTASPSCDSETLAIYAPDYPELGLIADYKIVVKQMDLFKTQCEQHPDGTYSWPKGLFKFRDTDGRIRSTYSPITVTGRERSSNPNLQNLANRVQVELDRIFDNKVPAVRSVFRADYESGNILVEADYSKAEAVVLALLSHDCRLLSDVRSPVNFHARNAVEMLGASCSFDEVKTKFPGLYISAKTVTFGGTTDSVWV